MKNTKILLALVLFITQCFIVKAQEGNYQSGAQSKALADASVALTGHWSAFNNPAGLAYSHAFSVGFYAEKKFNIKELNGGALVLAMPLGSNSMLAFDFYTFNNSIYYARQKFGLAYAQMLGKKLSYGIQFNLLRTYLENIGFNTSFCGELGLLYQFSDKLNIGTAIFNPTAQKYSKYYEDKIPSGIRLGLLYEIMENGKIAIEVENSTDGGYSFKGGLNYEVKESFSIQAGIRNNPYANSFGLAFKSHKININLSLVFMQVLDMTPGFSFDYLNRD